jgi:hypothetical protein
MLAMERRAFGYGIRLKIVADGLQFAMKNPFPNAKHWIAL